MKSLNIAGLILVIGLMIYLIYLYQSKTIDNFIVLLDEIVIPKECYNYILTDGSNYFLLNTNKMFDAVSNPMKFKSLEEAKSHLASLNYVYPDGKNVKCLTNIPVVNITQKKKKEDPTVSFQRECNKKISPNRFDLDVCSTYGSDLDSSFQETLSKFNIIESDLKQFANYDLETCMIDKAVSENPELNDINFKKEFSDYFSRLDDTIDQRFSYLTM